MSGTTPNLIAPCGLNCRLCRAYVREHNKCPGCRTDSPDKMKTCQLCQIKNCEVHLRGEVDFCIECSQFPCALITRLEKRYTAKYGTSVIENMKSIQALGIDQFVENENAEWTCPECGSMICMHQPLCMDCGYAWLANR